MIAKKRWISKALLGVIAATIASTAVEAAVVTRGPYLQLGTPTSVVIRWRTDVATNSRVSYGPAPGTLTSRVDNPSSTSEHQVALSGLSPNTVYFYSVGTTAQVLAGGDANHFFRTAPVPGTPKATRIWVLGDSGTADASARAVRDAYLAFTGTRHTDLWLMLGDNAYGDGTDSEYEAAVFDMYPSMLRKSVLWPTLGNHDGHSADSGSQSGPYYNIFTLPKNREAGGIASGTEAYYSFDHANIHFVVLDSFDSDRSFGGAMMNWLRDDLAANTRDWIIAFWHHPPYTKGSHDSDDESELVEMRENALPILEDHGVDLVLAGHSHSYERSYLVDGHYDTSDTLTPSMILDAGDGRPAGNGAYEKPSEGSAPHGGAVYTVAGSSGKTSGGSLDHPVMFISLNVLGSLVLDVEGNRLDAVFLDSARNVRDSFRILKPDSTPAPVTTRLFVDTPRPGAAVAQPFTIAGWAIDPSASTGTGVDQVHVWASPEGGSSSFLGVANYGLSRPDVGAAFGNSRFNPSGFSYSVSGLASGRYTINVYARSTVRGTFDAVKSVNVIVGSGSDPRMNVDVPAPGASPRIPFTVAGWAIDRSAPSGSGISEVHLWSFRTDNQAGTFLGVASLGIARPDVAAAFGAQFGNAGFQFQVTTSLPQTRYNLVAYAKSAVTGTFNNQDSVTVTVLPPGSNPAMALDIPSSGASMRVPFNVAGWAADLGSASGTGVDQVDLWAFPTSGAAPVFLGVATYGTSRPDVGAVYGSRFTSSGYSRSVTTALPAGLYDIAVYARSTVAGAFNNVRRVRIRVN